MWLWIRILAPTARPSWYKRSRIYRMLSLVTFPNYSTKEPTMCRRAETIWIVRLRASLSSSLPFRFNREWSSPAGAYSMIKCHLCGTSWNSNSWMIFGWLSRSILASSCESNRLVLASNFVRSITLTATSAEHEEKRQRKLNATKFDRAALVTITQW